VQNKLVDGIPPSSTALDEESHAGFIDFDELPQRSLRERRPVATDQGGVDVEVSSRSLLVVVVRVNWMSDGDDVPDGLERQVVDGGHGRGGGVERDG
jgi:hypothetical protein